MAIFGTGIARPEHGLILILTVHVLCQRPGEPHELLRRRLMIIRVLYEDDRHDYVPAFRLDDLIAEGKIKKFYRSDGWVTIGKDPIRGVGGSRYAGPERRKIYVVS